MENEKDGQQNKSELRAGTGFMLSLSDAIHNLERDGYTDNLIPHFDHLTCRSDTVRIDAAEIIVDKKIRIENTSDPDDQAILYAISVPTKQIRGTFSESYGLYHEPLSKRMVDALSMRKAV
jgi:hypothetical protein